MTRTDDALIEELLLALTLGLRTAGALTREVKRRGLLDVALTRAADRTRAERRRLGDNTASKRGPTPMTPTTAPKTKTAPFTDDEVKTIQRAAHRVWNEIAYDILQAVAEERGRSIDAVTIPRSHVLELVCDAGRLEDALPRDLGTRVAATDYAALLRLLRPAFTFARYGT